MKVYVVLLASTWRPGTVDLSLSRVLVKCETKPNNQNQMPLTYLCLVFSWVMLIVLHWLNKVSAIFDCEPTKQTGHHNGLWFIIHHLPQPFKKHIPQAPRVVASSGPTMKDILLTKTSLRVSSDFRSRAMSRLSRSFPSWKGRTLFLLLVMLEFECQ